MILSTFRLAYAFALVGVVVTGCVSKPFADKVEQYERLYSTFEKPSEASGDCGGWALWLNFRNGTIIGGESALFEGGCAIHPMKISDIEHDSVSDKLVMNLGNLGIEPSMVYRFEGRLSGETLVGTIVPTLTATGKPAYPHPHLKGTPRVFKAIDDAKFRSAIQLIDSTQ